MALGRRRGGMECFNGGSAVATRCRGRTGGGAAPLGGPAADVAFHTSAFLGSCKIRKENVHFYFSGTHKKKVGGRKQSVCVVQDPLGTMGIFTQSPPSTQSCLSAFLFF